VSAHTPEPCQYMLEEGIHQLIVYDFSRSGTDNFIDSVVNILLSSDAGLPMLVDSSRGSMPLGYMVKRFRELYRTTPKPPQDFKIAVLYQPSAIIGMIDSMIRLFTYTKVRLFKANEREKALTWLQQI
jgi:predicted YcjX-like family ATPase